MLAMAAKLSCLGTVKLLVEAGASLNGLGGVSLATLAKPMTVTSARPVAIVPATPAVTSACLAPVVDAWVQLACASDIRALSVSSTLAFGAKLSAFGSQDTYSPLGTASLVGREDVVKLLLALGADTEVKDRVSVQLGFLVAHVGCRVHGRAS